MNDNDDEKIVHLNVVKNDQSLEERGQQSVVEVLQEMLEMAQQGVITEFAACSIDNEGDAVIHVSSKDWLGAVGLFETGKHIFITQLNT
jgi:hypothetical protein